MTTIVAVVLFAIGTLAELSRQATLDAPPCSHRPFLPPCSPRAPASCPALPGWRSPRCWKAPDRAARFGVFLAEAKALDARETAHDPAGDANGAA